MACLVRAESPKSGEECGLGLVSSTEDSPMSNIDQFAADSLLQSPAYQMIFIAEELSSSTDAAVVYVATTTRPEPAGEIFSLCCSPTTRRVTYETMYANTTTILTDG